MALQKQTVNDKITRAAILIAVIGASIGFGYLTGSFSEKIVLLSLGVIIGAVAALTVSKWFIFSPFIILILASISPIAIETGTQTTISDGMIVTAGAVGLWVVHQLFSRRSKIISFTRVEFFLLLFIMIVPISLIWSWLFRDSGINYDFGFIIVQLATAFTMVLLPLLFLMLRKIEFNKTQIQWLFVLFIIIGALAILEKTPLKILTIEDRGLFPMWILTVCLGIILFNKQLSPGYKLILGLIAGGWLYYSFYVSSTWLSGWFPAFVSLSVLVFIRSRKLFFFILLVVALTMLLNINFIMDTLDKEITESGISRPLAWYRNLQLDFKHILFGTGPAGYRLYYEYYYPGQDVHLSHNNYLDIFAQTGIFGLLSFGIFFLLLLKNWIRQFLLKLSNFNWDTTRLAIGIAGLAGVIAAMGLGDWMIPFPYTQGIGGFDYIVYSWIILGLVETTTKVDAA